MRVIITSIIFVSIIIFLKGLFVSSASAQLLDGIECIANEKDDTALNVREVPNGKVINRLRNGRVLGITEYRNDSKNRPWGWATGYYNGELREWGWVFIASLNCREPLSYIPNTTPKSHTSTTQNQQQKAQNTHNQWCESRKALADELWQELRSAQRKISGTNRDGRCDALIESSIIQRERIELLEQCPSLLLRSKTLSEEYESLKSIDFGAELNCRIRD